MEDGPTLDELRAEATRYGLTINPNLTARELDRVIQEKVALDFNRGICSACGKGVHTSDC